MTSSSNVNDHSNVPSPEITVAPLSYSDAQLKQHNLELNALKVQEAAFKHERPDETFQEVLNYMPELLASKDQLGDTPLHNAIYQQNNPVTSYFIDKIIECQASFNDVNDDGQTPLMCLACSNLPSEFAYRMIQHGANIAIADKTGATVLHQAVRNKNHDLLRLLLPYIMANGMEHLLFGPDNHGDWPYSIAMTMNDPDTITIIYDASNEFGCADIASLIKTSCYVPQELMDVDPIVF